MLRWGAAASVGLGIRAALTGLPISFLVSGRVQAAQSRQRIAILASSSQGEPINVCGPGTYDDEHARYFTHPRAGAVDASEIIPQDVNGVRLGVRSLSRPAELTLGAQRVRMASCFSALEPELPKWK